MHFDARLYIAAIEWFIPSGSGLFVAAVLLDPFCRDPWLATGIRKGGRGLALRSTNLRLNDSKFLCNLESSFDSQASSTQETPGHVNGYVVAETDQFITLLDAAWIHSDVWEAQGQIEMLSDNTRWSLEGGNHSYSPGNKIQKQASERGIEDMERN